MKLSDFINRRLLELGMIRSDLVNKHDLNWSTLSNIDHDKPISKITQEKLAKALQCTMGDIQACFAEQNPLKGAIVNKKSLAKQKKTEDDVVKKVMEEKPYITPMPDELSITDEPDVEPEEDMMFPVETEEQLDNRITREVAEEMYKRKLKDKIGKILANTTHELTDRVRQEIGVMLLKELYGDE